MLAASCYATAVSDGLQHDNQRVDDSNDPKPDQCQNNVQEELGSHALIHEDGEWWKQDREDDLQQCVLFGDYSRHHISMLGS